MGPHAAVFQARSASRARSSACQNRASWVVAKLMRMSVVGRGVAWMPFHFGGWFNGEDLRANYPQGTDPYVLGESANTITTYGYDAVTGMQEPIVSCVNTPAQMAALAEQAQIRKARVQRLVDQVVSWFVPVVLLISAATMIGWLLTDHGLRTSASAALSVLIIVTST